MSLRARLVWVLAGVMVGPAVATWLLLGVLMPQASRRAQDAALGRAEAAVTTSMTQHCALLAERAHTVAVRLSGRVSLDAALARAAVAASAAEPDPGPAGIQLAVVAGSSVVASSADLVGSAPSAGASASALGTADLLALTGSTCASPVAVTSPALAETVAVPAASGAQLGRVLAYTVLDRAALDRWGAAVAPSMSLALTGPAESPAADSSGSAGAAVAVGTDDGRRYRRDPAPAGLPYGLVLSQPLAAGAPTPLRAAAVPLLAAGAVFAVLVLLAGRLARPITVLARTAQRLAAGEPRVRSGVRGRDEVGRLGEAIDALADRLETSAEDLERHHAALAETFAYVGETLANTHNLDALLRTVAEAARRGGRASAVAVLLGDGAGLAERVGVVPDGEPPARSAAVLDRLTSLASRAASTRETATADLEPLAGPALAVPMVTGNQMLGVLVLARAAGRPAFDEGSRAAVSALASHAATAVANVHAHLDAQRLSVTDPLTGAANVRHLTLTLSREVERAHRFGRTLSVLMLDLDHFKNVNDTLGHAFGDAVLREFAGRLHSCLREVDLVARRGGEEFAVVLPETGTGGAEAVVRRVMERVRGEPFRGPAGSEPAAAMPVTVSVGIATYPEHGGTAAAVLHAADVALYQAKREGRDRWCVAVPPPLSSSRQVLPR